MILGQYGVHPCECARVSVCVLKVDKAGLVCTNVQLGRPHCVDEVLIRALTAGVIRSASDARFWLGPWEPDGARGHEGRVAAEGHGTVTRLISLGQCTQHAFLHMNTHTNTHTFDCPPHTGNSQRFVIIRQEESYCAAAPALALQPSSLVPQKPLNHQTGSHLAPFSQPAECKVTLSRKKTINQLNVSL